MADSGSAGNGDEQEAVLDRLLTRLALTEDRKLETVLAKLLPYAISCLRTSRSSTRQKVMDILTHINKRVKDQPFIRLPHHDLLKLYQTEDSPMVKSFSLIYLEMALDRRSKEEADLAPDLLENISQVSPQHQEILLRMAVKEMEKYSLESIDKSCVANYKFVKTPADRDIFLEFCLQTIIYQFQSSSHDRIAAPPAGLSKLQAKRVCGKSPLTGDLLMTRKLCLLNVIAELNMPSELIYPSLIAASADSNDRVVKRADELLKRKAARINFEDPMLVKHLFSIYQGTIGDAVAKDAQVSPASPVLKVKLMGFFTHSIVAANSFPATLHCIFDCLYGNESYPRLKQAGMEFTIWVLKHAQNEQLKPMAPIILSGLLKLLEKQTSSEGDSLSKQLRAFAYQSIGQLGQRAPHLFRGGTEIVMRLFEAFKIEPPHLRFTVQEAVTSLASAYKDCSEVVARQVDTLLLNNVNAAEGEARFSAIWWANQVYGFQHCASRFICMLGASDDRLDVREMALEGLMILKPDGSVKGDYPPLSDMLNFICQQQPMLLAPAEIGERDLLFSSKTYDAMITFILKCYEAEANNNCLSFEKCFLFLLEHAMALDGSVELHANASTGLLAFASKNSQKFVELYCNRLPWLKQFLGHVDSATREVIARLVGIVSSGLSTQTTMALLEDLRSNFHVNLKIRFESMHGAVCAAGYVLAQCMTGVPKVPHQTISGVILKLIMLGRFGSPGLSGSVAEAIGHVGLRGPLPVIQTPNKGWSNDHTEAAEDAGRVVEPESEELSLESITKLFNDIISSKETKSVQKAVIAYGHLCYGNPEGGVLKEALDALFRLSRSKVEDVLFSVGEALCFIWGGIPVTADEILKSNFVSLSKASKFLTDPFWMHDDDMDLSPANGGSNGGQGLAREQIVHKLFDELLFSSRREERCAGAVWLVSIITYCGQHPDVQKIVPEIQEAFSYLLGDQEELTQEMASRGMSILYDLGNASTKDELVKALVSTLSGTAKRKRAAKLTEESEVFDEGVIGEKPGGGRLTTYKELCNLANEMGQPDLIYKFLDLANYHASLNSKRGAAFGFAKIAKQAGDALSPYLRSLVPKLLRYQYDPSKQIQDAMGHIWRSIVAEPKKTVDEYFDDIMEDLLEQAGSRLWRSRESSCLALADILQGRRFNEVKGYLERIWAVCFRAIDDIKETVRTAGSNLSRSVSSLTLRLCDTNLTAEDDAKATVTIVLPFLLQNGIMNNMADVQRLSITTIMKLAKSAGSSIRPQLPDLIICMLESLSSLEDQRLNYVELHAEKTGISTEKLESLRIAIAKDSPMWETLDFCVQQVDLQTLEVLVPRLIQLVRSGVGLNTRVGVAKFINLLTNQIGSDMKVFAGTLLRVLKVAVQNEKSSSSRRAFASACAAVVKHAGPIQIQSLFEDSLAFYRTGEANMRSASALLLKELSRNAVDVFVGHRAMVLPLAFVARFEEQKDVSDIFEEIWEENTSSEGVALQLYMSDIVPLVLEGLSSTSWTEKHKCAKAIAKIAEAAGDSISPFVQPMIHALLEELPTRLWEGKEVLLDALSAICISCSEVIPKFTTSNAVSRHVIVGAVTLACKRKKTLFRNTAFSCLGKILLQFKDPDLFEDVFPFLLQCCSHTLSSNAAATDADQRILDANESQDDYKLSLEKALLCLQSSINIASSSAVLRRSDAIVACLVEILNTGHTWQVKLAAVSATQAFVAQLAKGDVQEKSIAEEIYTIKSLESLFFAVFECISASKIGQLRIMCLECLVAMVEVTPLRVHLIKNAGETLYTQMSHLYELEKNASAKSLMHTIIKRMHDNVDTSCSPSG